jgi:hypothetical protein
MSDSEHGEILNVTSDHSGGQFYKIHWGKNVWDKKLSKICALNQEVQ